MKDSLREEIVTLTGSGLIQQEEENCPQLQTSKKWSLEKFFQNQLSIDELQIDFMYEYYEHGYKIHMEKKLQRKKRKEGFCENHSSSFNEDDFENFISIMKDCVIDQSDFPRIESEEEPLQIGEEGWTVLSHWMQPLFKKQMNNNCISEHELEMHCETCQKHENIAHSFENFKTGRRQLFEGTVYTPLKVFEKYIDFWSQGRYLRSTRYELSDHGCASVFSNGLLQCTLSHLVINRELQGKNPKEPHQIVCILNGLEQNKSISSIDLSSLLIVHDSVAKAICSMIRKKKSLKRLVISDLSLSKTVYTSNIIDAITDSTSLTQLEIMVYKELESNFRFLENVNRSDLKKLGMKKLGSFTLNSDDYNFPIDYVYLFEELLKNKFLNYLKFSIEKLENTFDNNNECDEYQQFCDNLYGIIDTIDEFHFQGYNFYNIDAQHEFHILKHAKNLQTVPSYSKLIEKSVDNQYYTLPRSCYLSAKYFFNIGFSHIAPFLNNIVKLTFKLSFLKNEEFELFSRAVLNAPVLEKMTLLKVAKLGMKSQLFSQYFKVPNKSKLRKIILTHFNGVDTTLLSDAFSTFLDLNYFPNLTALYIQGQDFQLDLKSLETLVTSIKQQEIHYPKGLKKLELPESSIFEPEITQFLLRSLMYNRLISTLGLSRAALKDIDLFVDFITTNKSVTELKLNYSDCTTIPEDLLCKSETYTPGYLKVFGAFQINWNLTAIDWYIEFYWNLFEFGSVNYVGERFLVERIMDRNKAQKHINTLMQPILLTEKYKQFSDISLTTISQFFKD